MDRRWTVDRYLQEPHTEYVHSEDSIKICLLHARKTVPVPCEGQRNFTMLVWKVQQGYRQFAHT